MAQFDKSWTSSFLNIVRKYMLMRGNMSQKELAEATEIGVSTMSRFLNQKTSDLNPQLIAKIVAALQVPLHEIIDFVEEDYAERFIKLVKFYRDDEEDAPLRREDIVEGDVPYDDEELLVSELATQGGSKRSVKSSIKVGGRRTTLAFEPDQEDPNSTDSIRDKIQGLSPRQKAYMTDFLNLDMEGRDLIVDLGNSLFRYFRQKGMQL